MEGKNKCQLKTSPPTVAPADGLAIKNTIFFLICQAIRLHYKHFFRNLMHNLSVFGSVRALQGATWGALNILILQ
jgi:hypothetical protein